MIDARWWRRRLGRALPEFVKAPLRARLFGFRPSRSHLAVTILREHDPCAVRIDGLPEFRAPASMLPDLEYHLVNNGDSIDEIANLLDVARRPGGLLFDVGGHKSLLSVLFCLASPRNRAVSFEPSPAPRMAAERLRALNGLDERLTLSALAIGDEARLTDGYADAHGQIVFGPAPNPADRIAVEFSTIDAECQRLGMTPDVVKIDIEGFEDRALAGARRLLAAHPPILLLEFHLDQLEQRRVRPRDLLASLAGYGYTFFDAADRPISADDVARSASAIKRFMARPTVRPR